MQNTLDKKAAPRVAFVTLGCAKNEVDTDKMRAAILASNYELEQEIEHADVIVVNSCSFLQEATQESIDTILEILEQDQELGRDTKIILSGCVPSRYKADELKEVLPEVSAFVRAQDEEGLLSVISEITGIEAHSNDSVSIRTLEAPYAYVKISEGCDRMCTFCAIPFIRGRYVSRPQDEIIAEVKELIGHGVQEIILIGQDTGVWGEDLSENANLADLLKACAKELGPIDGRLKILYLQPEGLNDKLINTIKDTPQISNYIDIPLQHSSARVLELMNREGGSQYYLEVIEKLRKLMPDMVIRSTFISGFPSETEEEHQELLDFLEKAQFDFAGVFMYSAEEGTKAFRMDGHIDEDTKLRRAQEVKDLLDEIGFAKTQARVGDECEVIIEDFEEFEDASVEALGRAWFQAPDSDGIVHIPNLDAQISDRVRVRFVESFAYDLEGEVL